MTLIKHITLIEETRSDINLKHDLVDVMFLAISAIMSGAEEVSNQRNKLKKASCDDNYRAQLSFG